MKPCAFRCIILAVILTSLWGPMIARAQAPVVSSFSITTLVATVQNVMLYQNTTWSGGVSYDGRLAYTNLTQPTNGIINYPYAGACYCTYQCTNLNFRGLDSFVWYCAFGTQTSGLATCSITVASNTPPVVLPCTIFLPPGTTNFTDEYLGSCVVHPASDSSQTMTYFIRSPPQSGGSLSLSYGSSYPYFTYCAPAGFSGKTDSFTWAASDGMSTSAPATCTITSVNTIPTATPCSFSVLSGALVTNAMPYTDPDFGQFRTAVIVSQPAHGVAYSDASGGVNLDYVSAPGFVGTDTFTFAISDGFSVSASAVCTMIVAPSPPVALAQTVVTMKNTPITIPLSYAGGGGYTCWPVRVSATWATTGTLTTNGNIFILTPKTNWTGTDSFTWKMTYSNAITALTNSATVTCSIVVKDVGSNTNCDWTQWRFDECRTAQSPLVLPNAVYKQWQRTLPVCAGAYDGMAYQCSANNQDIDLCRPVQLGKHLFVPCLANDSLTDYNTDTGAQNWRYYAGGALRRPPLAMALTNGTNVVIFGCDDGWLYCLNAVDGSEVWKFRVAPNAKKAMGFRRLSSVWPVWGSPVSCSNQVFAVAGYMPSWNLFGCCLDAASGRVIWQNDSAWLPASGHYSSLGPLAFSADHSKIYGTQEGRHQPWMISPLNGQLLGLYGTAQAKPNNPPGFVGEPFWFVDGSGKNAIGETMQSIVDQSVITKPMQIFAGGQTFTPASVAGLGVLGNVGCMLAGDSKLFVTTTDGNLYCFGGSNTTPTIYANTVTPLPATTDAWTAVVQKILTNRPDLGQGLALVWGVGSGRLATELAKQAPGLMIVAADPNPAKLRAIRTVMDAAGLPGARVSTLQGNPMDCGFAPYQAALIVSEDVNVAGYSNGMAMAQMLYKCSRPFGGQIWLPTNDVSNLSSWLNAAKLPTCGGGASYQVSAQSISGLAFTCIQRLGLPDANLALTPPFRLTAFDAADGNTLDPFPPFAGGVNPVKGVKGGYDIYSWLPVSAGEPGYEPPVVSSNNAQVTIGYAYLSAPQFSPTLTNLLFSRLEAKPELFACMAQGWNCCSKWDVFNSTILSGGKMGWIGDAVNNWGMVPFPEAGACGGNTAAGNGTVAFGPSQTCACNAAMDYTQFGFVSADDPNDEQWPVYCHEQSMRSVQELPIRSIGVNFGAIGDRLDAGDQLLWTHHPWHGGRSSGAFQIEAKPLIPVSYRGSFITNQYHYSGVMSTTSNVHGWVAASYVGGMTGMTIPLARPLVATRITTPPVVDGALTDACWSSCSQIDLATSCNTNDTRCYFMMCYDATNLYLAGVYHRQGPRDSNSDGIAKVHMKVALAGRDAPMAPAQTLQLGFGDGATNCIGLASNAWTCAFKTNVEMFTGAICVPWTNLTAAGIWTSQLVMNVQVCGNILNGNHYLWDANDNSLLLDSTCGITYPCELPYYFSPVYFDAARGPVSEVIPHTVRLYFAEMEGLTNGQRVFDVLLQGQTVLTNFDVFSTAGGKSCGEVVREFNNIGIADKLNIAFVAKYGQPILGGVEIIATADNAANQTPVAVLDASTLSGTAPLDVQFSAQRSYDPDGQIAECAWNTGDGRVTRGSRLHHVFTEPGTYQVCLLVTDNRGATTATNVPVTVTAGAPAAFVINIRSNNAPNGDYICFENWNPAAAGTGLPCDLTSSTMVYHVSSTGNCTTADNLTAVTFTGGKTGILRYVANWVTNAVTNTYVAIAFVGGTGTVNTGTITAKSGHTLTINDAGVLTASWLFTVPATNTYVASRDDGQTVVFAGGGMGLLRHINHATPPIALITECRGLIQTGTVMCASGHTFAVSDTGHPVYSVVANCYNDWPNGLHYNVAVALSGAWITDPTHCVVIRSALGQGHLGKIKGTNGVYTGFALTVPLSAGSTPYTRINQIIVDANAITLGNGCCADRVLGSVTAGGSSVTVANSIGPAFNVAKTTIYPYPLYQDISFHNCTGGAFILGDLTANRIRVVNCLAYSNTAGFAAEATQTGVQEIWLNHCVSSNGSATASDAWKDGNIGNLANQTVSFVNAGNDYHLAASDTGAIGKGQPGLGADIDGNLRPGPFYDVGAHQTTNAQTPFQQWQMQYFGSITALNAASNAVNSAGISNYQMFLAGSDPNNSNTWFRFTALAPVIGHRWGMSFNTVSGKSYTVTWKTNLLDGIGWQFYTNFSNFGGSTQVIFTNSLPQAFFQIQAQ